MNATLLQAVDLHLAGGVAEMAPWEPPLLAKRFREAQQPTHSSEHVAAAQSGGALHWLEISFLQARGAQGMIVRSIPLPQGTRQALDPAAAARSVCCLEWPLRDGSARGGELQFAARPG